MRRISGNGSVTILTVLLCLAALTTAAILGCAVGSRAEAQPADTAGLTFVREMDARLSRTTNRLEQESVLRAIYWHVMQADSGMDMKVEVTGGDGKPVPELSDLTVVENLKVTLHIQSVLTQNGRPEWTHVIRFVPYHINNVYLLLSDSGQVTQ